jgi:hypothetical protein
MLSFGLGGHQPAPESTAIEQRQKAGEDVSEGEVVKAAAKDAFGTIDPGFVPIGETLGELGAGPYHMANVTESIKATCHLNACNAKIDMQIIEKITKDEFQGRMKGRDGLDAQRELIRKMSPNEEVARQRMKAQGIEPK